MYANLSLDAQMNIEADHEAEKLYHHPTFRYHPLVPLFPSRKAHLLIDGIAIPCHYHKYIRYGTASPEFLAQCCKTQGWSLETTDLIDKPLLRNGVRFTLPQTPVRRQVAPSFTPHTRVLIPLGILLR
jgi:hypothetical protein